MNLQTKMTTKSVFDDINIAWYDIINIRGTRQKEDK